MLTVEQQVISAEAFWEIIHLPENEGRKLELVEGVVIEMAGGGSGKHGEVAGNAFGLIWNFVREHNLGRVTAAETCYTLHKNPHGKDIVRCPDVGFVRRERAPQPLPAGFVPFAPDLAVEVVSPGNEASAMHNKVLDYLRYGTTLIWIIYPDSQTLVVHTASGARTLMPEDTLDGADVLPGFTLPVSAIFPA